MYYENLCILWCFGLYIEKTLHFFEIPSGDYLNFWYKKKVKFILMEAVKLIVYEIIICI